MSPLTSRADGFDALREFQFLARFPAVLRPKVEAILRRADGATGKRGISSAPSEFRSYERGALIAQLIQFAVSRQREYLADASGALLCRNPDALARALEKIAADPEPLEAANKATAHLYISNPLKEHASMLNGLFSTHPPVAERVRLLRAM